MNRLSNWQGTLITCSPPSQKRVKLSPRGKAGMHAWNRECQKTAGAAVLVMCLRVLGHFNSNRNIQWFSFPFQLPIMYFNLFYFLFFFYIERISTELIQNACSSPLPHSKRIQKHQHFTTIRFNLFSGWATAHMGLRNRWDWCYLLPRLC